MEKFGRTIIRKKDFKYGKLHIGGHWVICYQNDKFELIIHLGDKGEVETIDWSGGYIKVSNGGVGRVRITESTGL